MKPMLAAPVDLKILRYPVYASPKLDGIRALIINGVVVGRSLKPIPNKHVQSLFGKSEYEGLDGELIFGPPTAPDVFNKTSSAVMTIEGTLPVKFYTFDYIGTPLFEYSERLKVVQTVENEHVFPVKHSLCFTEEDLLIIEQRRLDEGYEGLILRSMTGAYKYGRSTAREQGMLKMKRFTDDEAVIIGFEELMHNANEAKINELGHTERSSHKANMVPTGRLGTLLVRNKNGVEFGIGTGFDDAMRHTIWDHQDLYMGRIVKYKSFLVGVKDKPRFPVFLGFRNEVDMS